MNTTLANEEFRLYFCGILKCKKVKIVKDTVHFKKYSD